MSLSSLCIEQREKETQTLKFLLGYSLLGSVLLHCGLLALGAAVPWSHAPLVQDQDPVEVVVVDPPPDDIKEDPIELPSETLTSAGGGGDGDGVSIEDPTPGAPPPLAVKPQPVEVPEKQETPKQTRSKPSPPDPIAVKAPANVEGIAVGAKPSSNPGVTSNDPSASTSGTPSATGKVGGTGVEGGVEGGTGTGTGGTGTGIGTGTGSGIGSGSGSGTGSGIGSGSGSGTGEGIGSGTGSGTGTETGTDNRQERRSLPAPLRTAASTSTPRPRNTDTVEQAGSTRGLVCRDCPEPVYPSSARRRRAEGDPKIAFDVDESGRATNVRISQSSGNEDLDRAAVQAAGRWRFDSTAGRRRNVPLTVQFELEGSERQRRNRENRNQRQEVARNSDRPSPSTSTPARNPEPVRQRRITRRSSEIPRLRRSVDTPAPRLRQRTAAAPRIRQETPTRRRRTAFVPRPRPQSAVVPRQRRQAAAPRPRLRQSSTAPRPRLRQSTPTPRVRQSAPAPSTEQP